MSISFHRYVPNLESDSCSICLEELNVESVAHGKENLHAMCKKCAMKWLRIHPACPICRKHVDVASLFSWKERTILEWNRAIDEVDPKGFTRCLAGVLWGIMGRVFVKRVSVIPVAFAIIFGFGIGLQAFKTARVLKKDAALMASLMVTVIILNYEELFFLD